MTILHEGGRKEGIAHSLVFNCNDCPGAGYGFPCDEKGLILDAEMQPPAWENLAKCLLGIHDVTRIGVKTERWHWWDPDIILCDHCRKGEVTLYGFTNTCPVCQADYNFGGQRLAPRSQWGEETGQTAADILRPYAPGEDW
jgi:hypothetical protein